ncbi:MAG: hypothetical protein ACRDTF_17340 [Pseudonocardiaceae bacterium]
MTGGFEQAGAQVAGAGAAWGAIGNSFARADAQLVGINGQQTDLQRAVLAGELWLDPNVARLAVIRCEQARGEINESLNNARRLVERGKFGDNEDGNAAGERFARAGHEYIAMLEKARTVVENMAATYEAAGRTVAETDEAGRQSFRGGSE